MFSMLTIRWRAVPNVLLVMAGTGYGLLASRMLAHEPLRWVAAWALLALTPVVVIVGVWSRSPIRLLAFLMQLGLWLGVVIDVLRDTKERNLFPLEMVLWSVLVMPSLLVGVAILWTLRRS